MGTSDKPKQAPSGERGTYMDKLVSGRYVQVPEPKPPAEVTATQQLETWLFGRNISTGAKDFLRALVQRAQAEEAGRVWQLAIAACLPGPFDVIDIRAARARDDKERGR